jgi:glycosyltransferase involved in cell wall biosynthesis
MPGPLVSIVVPVHNAQDFLRPCVDSILAQTHRNLEVILVNDGSKDGSGALCDAFAGADPRVRVLHKANGGAASARNAGLDLARGDFVQFVDCDDTIASQMTEKLLAALSGGAELAICGYRRVPAPGSRERGADYSLGESLPDLDRAAFLGLWPRLFRAGGLRSPCNKLYRAALIRARGLRFPEGLRLGEDFSFNLEFYANAQRFAVLADILYNYLDRSNGSVTGAYFPNCLDDAKTVTQANRRFLEANGCYLGEHRQVCASAFLDKVIHCLRTFARSPQAAQAGALQGMVARVLQDPQIREELPFARASSPKRRLLLGLLRWRQGWALRGLLELEKRAGGR